MRGSARFLIAMAVGAWLSCPGQVPAQTQPLSDTECETLRQRLAGHAELSEGVRRDLAGRVAQYRAAAPAPSTVTTTTPITTRSTDRAEAIRLRLEQIPREREQLEDQRLAALVKFKFGRANQIQEQIWALDREKGDLEKELAELPAAGIQTGPTSVVTQTAPSGTISTVKPVYTWTPVAGATTYEVWVSTTTEGMPIITRTTTEETSLVSPVDLAPDTLHYWWVKPDNATAYVGPVTFTPTVAKTAALPPIEPTDSGSAVARIPCRDILAAYDTAVKIRQKELGAREGQAGVLPLVALSGQSRGEIAQELTAQFAAWPEARSQVGLLDQDGDGRLDGFADVPVQNVFRLYRQRADGTVAINVFARLGPGARAGYGEPARRLDEEMTRRTRRSLADLLVMHAAGPVRVLAETAQFQETHAQFLAGNFAGAARVEGGAARSVEFQNFRGESIRLLESFVAARDSVVMRQVRVLGKAEDREVWEETTIRVRPTSYWRTDVEVATSREARTSAGTPVGTRSTIGPIEFSLER